MEIFIQSYTGHDKKEWDPNVPKELAKIKQLFKDKIKAGFRAFISLADGTMKPITAFDEEAERIIMTAEKTIFMQPVSGG